MTSFVTVQPGTLSVSKQFLCGRDKSLTHRALIFAAMGQGVSQIRFPLEGEDCLATRRIFEALGVEVTEADDSWLVKSPGVAGWNKKPRQPLDCQNSGTTARLLTGLFAAIPGFEGTLIGDESLSRRPMDRVVQPLLAMGAEITGASGGKTLPLSIRGKSLQLKDCSIDKATAQVKSALLLAATQSSGSIRINMPSGARDHTEQILKKLGGQLRVEQRNAEEIITFTGPLTCSAIDWSIPVDPSSAAFFSVLGLLQPLSVAIKLPEVLQNVTRLGFVQVLHRMSQRIKIVQLTERSREFVEPVMQLEVEGGAPLSGVEISEAEVPTLVDEIPILAVAAAFANGPSRFRGLAELRVKESDRLQKTAELLQLAGAEVKVEGNDLLIAGGLKQARAFHYDPVGDHRLAMAGCVMARFAEGPCKVDHPECVAVSFPAFFELFDQCR